MSSRFVVEAQGRVVGLALRVQGGFRFFASEAPFRRLERTVYPRARSLVHAVRRRAEALQPPAGTLAPT